MAAPQDEGGDPGCHGNLRDFAGLVCPLTPSVERWLASLAFQPLAQRSGPSAWEFPGRLLLRRRGRRSPPVSPACCCPHAREHGRDHRRAQGRVNDSDYEL